VHDVDNQRSAATLAVPPPARHSTDVAGVWSRDARACHAVLARVIIADYDDDRLQLKLIRAEVEVLAGKLRELGFEHEECDLAGDSRSATIRQYFRNWQPSNRRVLVYWAGHGQPDGVDEFFLFGKETRGHPGTGNAISATELGQWLADKDADSIVLIVDSCTTGGGAREIFSAFDKRTENRSRRPRLAVIGTAGRHQKAREGVFVRAFRSVLFDGPPPATDSYLPWSEHDEYLTPDEVTRAVEEKLRREGVRQLPECKGGGIGNFFPNPRSGNAVPDIQVDLKKERAAWIPAEIREHFMMKYRGIDAPDELGWYFAGRETPLRQVVTWLRTQASGLLLITGPPGCGKSALLGRLAVLSDPGYRKQAEAAGALADLDPTTDPEENTITAGIHAKNKTLLDCVASLAAALGIGPPQGRWLNAAEFGIAIRNYQKPITLLVDALDEARPGDQAAIGDLLREVASTAGVRVIVGSRPDRITPVPGTRAAAGADGTTRQLTATLHPDAEINLAHDPQRVDSVAAYVRRRLRDIPGSVYRSETDRVVATAAWAIAEQSGGIFLFGRLLARTFANRDDVLDLHGDEARKLLSGGVFEAFAADLRRFGADQNRVRDILLPLAWAEGAGLPRRRIWLSLANALCRKYGRRYGEADLAWTLEHCGAFLIESGEDGQTVYRLFHQAFSDYFRHDADEEEVQEVITGELLASVEMAAGSDWPSANPYIYRHLATHAAAADWLDLLVSDPDYLIHADPARLARALPSIDLREHTLGRLYWRALDRLHSQSPAERAAALQVTALAEEPAAVGLVETCARLPWRGVWASGPPSPLQRQLIGHTAVVNSVAAGRLADDMIVASASEDGTIRVWNLFSGRQMVTLRGHAGRVYAAALVSAGSTTLCVSGGQDCSVIVWDIATGGALFRLTEHSGGVTAVAIGEIDREPVIVSGSSDATVRVWGLESGSCQTVIAAHRAAVTGVGIAAVSGRPVIVSSGLDRHVRTWDAKTGSLMLDIGPFEEAVLVVAIGALAARSVIVAGGYGDRGYVYDAETGQLVGILPDHVDGVFAATIGDIAGRPLIATGGAGPLHIWSADMRRQQTLSPPRCAEVSGVALASSATMSVAISAGSADNSIRMWYTDVADPGGVERSDPSAQIVASNLALLSGQLVVAIASSGNVDIVRVRGESKRAEVRISDPASISVASDQNRTLIAAASPDGVDVFDARTGYRMTERIEYRVARNGGTVNIPVQQVDLHGTGSRFYIAAVSRSGDLWVTQVVRNKAESPTAMTIPRLDPERSLATSATCVAVGEVGKSVLVVCGCSDGRVLTFSADTSAYRASLYQHPGAVRLLATAQLSGQMIVASASAETIAISRADVSALEILIPNARGAAAIAVGEFAGRPVLAVATRGGHLRILDLTTGREIGRIAGLGEEAHRVAMREHAGRAIVLVATAPRVKVVDITSMFAASGRGT
jgi:WD40 repeat protein